MLILCETQKNNAFTKGTTNFRSAMLKRHVAHHDHVDALRADATQGEFHRAVRKALNEKEEAVLVGLKAVYWAADTVNRLEGHPVGTSLVCGSHQLLPRRKGIAIVLAACPKSSAQSHVDFEAYGGSRILAKGSQQLHVKLPSQLWPLLTLLNLPTPN